MGRRSLRKGKGREGEGVLKAEGRKDEEEVKKCWGWMVCRKGKGKGKGRGSEGKGRVTLVYLG